MATEVTHLENRKRFALTVDGESAGFCDYTTPQEGVRDFNHTVTKPEFRGQGLSSVVIKAALDDTREKNMTAVASCSAVRAFVDKNPEYADIVRA